MERRQGTLWKYSKEYRKDLVEEMEQTKVPSRNVNKVLWWKQPYITKDEIKKMKKIWYK